MNLRTLHQRRQLPTHTGGKRGELLRASTELAKIFEQIEESFIQSLDYMSLTELAFRAFTEHSPLFPNPSPECELQ